jgi:hypothetical protein
MAESRAAVQRFHDNHYRYAYEPFIRGFGITGTASY